MPKRNDNIKTIADFNGIENDSPNVRSTSYDEGMAITNNTNHFNYNSNDSTTKRLSLSTTTAITTPKVYHIPHLHNDTYAKQLLHRVVQEFLPILQRRQYNVMSISELCCCNDGLDFQHEMNAQQNDGATIAAHHQNQVITKTTKRRRGRKIRKVADNIWGYNRTTFSNYGGNNNNNNNNNRKQHTIHIRLRHTNDHTKFLLYEDVAGTLAHELSHCEHGPHDAKFFKLMDDILEEHANIMYNNQLTTTGTAKSLSLSAAASSSLASTTPFSGTGQRLGSGVIQGLLGDDGTNATAATATMGQSQGGQVLGGDLAFVQWMSPKDAAVIAAETRRRQQLLRLRGDHDCCRPCYDDDEEDDNDDDDNEGPDADIKNGTRVETNSGSCNETDWNVAVKNEKVESGFGVVNFIDLTELDDDDTYSDECHNKDTKTAWCCHRCTYRNRPLSLVCDICSTTRQILRSD